MKGYTKLFGSIIGSTIWREPDHVRIVWITMLALKDKYHRVEASVPGLADFARVSLEKCLEALEVLKANDKYSRTKANGGRRIEEIEGGWVILNGEKYREKMSADERKESNRIYQRRFRDKQKIKDMPRNGTPLPGEQLYERAVEREDGSEGAVLKSMEGEV